MKDVLDKASGIFAEEVVHDFGVGLHVKLHLSLLHNLSKRYEFSVWTRGGLTYFEAGFGNTWLDVEAVRECVILDDGDGTCSRQRGGMSDSIVFLGSKTSGRRRNGHLRKKFEQRK